MVVAGLVAVIAAVWFILDSLAAREAANEAAKAHCARRQLQFLDGTVAFSRLGVANATGGGWTLRREFAFDFSANGMTRCRGLVTMHGRRVQAVDLPPDCA